MLTSSQAWSDVLSGTRCARTQAAVPCCSQLAREAPSVASCSYAPEVAPQRHQQRWRQARHSVVVSAQQQYRSISNAVEDSCDAPEGVDRTHTAEIAEILPLLSPKQLADAILSATKLDMKPSERLMSVIAAEVNSKLPQFRSQDLSNTIWAFGMLKYQPDQQWWQDFERQVYVSLGDFNDRELANLLWGFAVLGQKHAWVLDNLLSISADNMASYSPTSLHLIVWSLGKMNHVPSKAWVDAFLKASQPVFFQFSPSEMANIIWALAKLGVKLPSVWLDSFLMVAQWRFPNFNAKLLSIMAWSAATLDHRPSQEWLLCFEQQVRESFPAFSAHELACTAWALRKFGASNEHNAVFYMLARQESFLEVDFEFLSNSALLQQVTNWQKGIGAGSA